MNLILEARQITKRFRDPATITLFEKLDLRIEKGTSTAIVGASGQGKSTLLQIFGTLEPIDEGLLLLLGEEINCQNAPQLRNRQIGFVFQAFHLLEEYTVLENVLMPAWLSKKSIKKGSEAYLRALSLLEKAKIVHQREALAKQLSGGEKQRVALARALCNDPDLLLADEPSGNLDDANATFIHEWLLDLVANEGKTLLVVTHDQRLANLCQNCYLLQEKRLWQKR